MMFFHSIGFCTHSSFAAIAFNYYFIIYFFMTKKSPYRVHWPTTFTRTHDLQLHSIEKIVNKNTLFVQMAKWLLQNFSLRNRTVYLISHRIQITYRMFTPIGANGKLLTLNFHIDTGAATSSQNNQGCRKCLSPENFPRTHLFQP